MAEIDKEKLRRAIVNRGMVVPVVEYDDGSQGWGVPGLLMEPIEAWQRLQAGASDNVARMQQGLPFDPQAAGDAFAVTGAAAMGSVAAPKPAGAYVTSGAPMQKAQHGIRAYHGSPHDYAAERLIQWPDGRTEYIVGKPDVLPDIPAGAQALKDFPLGRARLDKMGSGEGAQAYGPGWYAAEAEEVGRRYRDGLTGSLGTTVNNLLDINNGNVRAALKQATAFRKQASKGTIGQSGPMGDPKHWDEVISHLDQSGGKVGRMYEVNINADPGDFLDWDAPIYGQQKAFDALYPDGYVGARENITEANAGSMLAREGQLNEKAAQALREAGIPGIKYFDQGSRGAGQGSRNYVVFDDSLISIVKKYGIAGAASLYGVSELELMEAMQERGL